MWAPISPLPSASTFGPASRITTWNGYRRNSPTWWEPIRSCTGTASTFPAKADCCSVAPAQVCRPYATRTNYGVLPSCWGQ